MKLTEVTVVTSQVCTNMQLPSNNTCPQTMFDKIKKEEVTRKKGRLFCGGFVCVFFFFKKMPGSLEQVSGLKSSLLAKSFPSPWTNQSCFHFKVSYLEKEGP